MKYILGAFAIYALCFIYAGFGASVIYSIGMDKTYGHTGIRLFKLIWPLILIAYLLMYTAKLLATPFKWLDQAILTYNWKRR